MTQRGDAKKEKKKKKKKRTSIKSEFFSRVECMGKEENKNGQD